MESSHAAGRPTQRIIPIRREYIAWVADGRIADYSPRGTPLGFRPWSLETHGGRFAGGPGTSPVDIEILDDTLEELLAS